jgi:hypothetical protein
MQMIDGSGLLLVTSEPVNMTLDELIAAFKLDSTFDLDWADSLLATNRCSDASDQFAIFCVKKGFTSGVLTLNMPQFAADRIGCSPGHCVTIVDGFEHTVDWTARQYRRAADFPLLRTEKQLCDEWAVVGMASIEYLTVDGRHYLKSEVKKAA